MNYLVYALHFLTPVHFGCAETGGKLEQHHLAFEADRLFSALCCELAAAGDENGLASLYDAVTKDTLAFSDLFPYAITADEDWQFYVPKPILTVQRKAMETKRQNLANLQKDMTAHKKQKKLQYLRASQLEAFIQALKTGEARVWDIPDFGQGQLMTRVNSTGAEPLPYYVLEYTFSRSCGLYGILAYEDEEQAKWVLSLLAQLGLTGIGGKRSSGCGKFRINPEEVIWLDEAGVYDDDVALYGLMTKEGTSCMNLSVLLPEEQEIPIVAAGQYRLLKRSGFITPDGRQEMTKKNDVYMVEAGSCFTQPMHGSIITVGPSASHPVWRYGKGLFAGLEV